MHRYVISLAQLVFKTHTHTQVFCHCMMQFEATSELNENDISTPSNDIVSIRLWIIIYFHSI